MSNQNFTNLENDIDFKNVCTDENLCLKPECTFHVHRSKPASPRWHCMAHRCQEQMCNVYKNCVSYPCGSPVFQCLASCDVLTNNKYSSDRKQDLQQNRTENQHRENRKSQENTTQCTHKQQTKNSQYKYDFPAKWNNTEQELKLNNSNGLAQCKDDYDTGSKGSGKSKNRINVEETYEKSPCGKMDSSNAECRHTNFLSMILTEKLVSNKTSVVHLKCNNCEISSKGVMIFIPIEGDLFNNSHEKCCKSCCSSKTSITEEKTATSEKDFSRKYEDVTVSEMHEMQSHISKVFVQKHLNKDEVYTQCKYCGSFSQGILIFLPSPVDNMFSKENLNSDNTTDKQQNTVKQEDVKEYTKKINLVSKVFVQTFTNNRANQIYVQCKDCENISRGIFIFLSSRLDYFDINNINCSKSTHTLLKTSENYDNFKDNCVPNKDLDYSLNQDERNHRYKNCKQFDNPTNTEYLNIINGSMNQMKSANTHFRRVYYGENSDNECILETNNETKVMHGKTNKHNQRIKQSVASFILNSTLPAKNNTPDTTEKNVCCMEDIMGSIPFYCNKCESTDNDISNESCVESVSDNSENTQDSYQ